MRLIFLNKFTLLLFDLDDTLLDFSAYWDVAIKDTMRIHYATQGLDTDILFRYFKERSDSLWPLYQQKVLSLKDYRRLRKA